MFECFDAEDQFVPHGVDLCFINHWTFNIPVYIIISLTFIGRYFMLPTIILHHLLYSWQQKYSLNETSTWNTLNFPSGMSVQLHKRKDNTSSSWPDDEAALLICPNNGKRNKTAICPVLNTCHKPKQYFNHTFWSYPDRF